MCSKWAPRRCRHIWIRQAKFSMTLPHSSLGIALIAAFSFKSVLQKHFVSLALKKCAPNELPGAAGTFGSGGQSSRWPSRISPLGSLLLLLWLLPSGQGWSGVVAIHPVLEVSPHIKISGVQVRWMRRPLRVTPAADQSVRETLL